MDTELLNKLCRCDAVIGPLFEGVFPADLLPQKIQYPTALIANTDPHTKPGSYWVAIYIDPDGVGDYFDSYGRPPIDHFRKYLDRHCLQWDYSNRPIQEILTSTCGQYCLYFLYNRCRGVSMSKILASFDAKDRFSNDQFVCKFVRDVFDAKTCVCDVEFLCKQIANEFK